MAAFRTFFSLSLSLLELSLSVALRCSSRLITLFFLSFSVDIFLPACLYQGLPVKLDSLESDDARAPKSERLIEGAQFGAEAKYRKYMVPYLSQIILGSFSGGFIDPITGKQRRVPVETLRYDISDLSEQQQEEEEEGEKGGRRSLRNSDEEDDEDEDESQLRAAAKSAAGADDVFGVLDNNPVDGKQQQKKEERRQSTRQRRRRKNIGVSEELSSPASGGRLVYTAARNSALFTTAPLMTSFRVPGALGLNHPPADGNGASSDIFLLGGAATLVRDHESESAAIRFAVDGRYSLVGYIVRGLDLALALQDGDIISDISVEYGAENLVRPKTSIKDIFLGEGGSES